ncbi:MAG: isoprenylcysteine carboxylmethyltransferase family protein [Bacteroidales bacterium]
MKISYFIKHFIGTFLFFIILFISAGRLNYWQGWIYVSIGLIMFLLSYTVLRIDTELLTERSKPGIGTKKWDKLLLSLAFPPAIASYIIAGLDSGRYHWSPNFHWSLYFIGATLVFLGQLLFLLAQKQNKFFSSTVRIQTERGQTVCETGIYKIVRHPAYLGTILQFIGFPLLLGSIWSIIPIMLSITLFIIRTNMEDRALINELRGYLEYTTKTKYKIIPYVW